MNRFSAKFSTKDRDCDHFVEVWHYTAQVFADNADEASRLVRGHNRTIDNLELKDEGAVENVPLPGIVITSEVNLSDEILARNLTPRCGEAESNSHSPDEGTEAFLKSKERMEVE